MLEKRPIKTKYLHYLHELLLELVRENTLGAETFGDKRHRLLGLRVEGGVHDEAVDEHPQVVLHLKRKGYSRCETQKKHTHKKDNKVP